MRIPIFGRSVRRRQMHRGHGYGRGIGGVLLSLLAFLGWRNRDRIRQYFHQRRLHRQIPEGGGI